MNIKKKIAIIVQRYGEQVNGGAEVHAQMIAEKLGSIYDLTVLTSCAIDYRTWEPVLPDGFSEIHGIKILRFKNEKRASSKVQNYYRRKMQGKRLPQLVYHWLGKPDWWLKIFSQSAITGEDAVGWLEAQGPAMPLLLKYLDDHKNEYNAFIFFTLLYYPAALGILKVPGKSILIPTVHDEKASYFPIYQKVMAAAEWIFFNTMAEMKFSEGIFNIEEKKKMIAGTGIDTINSTTDISVPAKFGIAAPYIVYVGRISAGKGCNILIEYFNRYIKETSSGIKLVLVGNNNMPVRKYPSVIFTGFVTTEEKNQLLKQAIVLIIPSLYESLSLVLLESFALRTPAIVNAGCRVLQDHIEQSGGGWSFYNYTDFKSILTRVITVKELKEEKGNAGYDYVKKEYSWNRVLHDFNTAIEDIENNIL